MTLQQSMKDATSLSMKVYRRFFCLALPALFASPANGQTLEEVLSSVQERKQVLEQAQAFIRDEDATPNDLYPNGTAGTFELISWTGSPAFPTNGDLASLGIEGRIRLLNEARRHFQIIRAGFVDVAPERIDGTEGTRPPAVVRRFDELSLPTPPTANHVNYLEVLRELACKVDALRVTHWPVNYTLTTGTHDNGTPHATQTTGADKLQWSEIDSTASVSRWFWAPERPVTASFRVGGNNYEFNEGTEENPDWQPKEYRHVKRVWPSEFTLSYIPQAVTLPSGVAPIGGTCVALAELHNSPYLPASGTGTAATPIPREGGYKVLATKNSAGTQAIPAPEWVVSGTWVPSGAANTSSIRNEMVFKPTLAAASRYDSYFSAGYPEKYSCVEQSIIFLMIPSFSKGLDATNEANERADYCWDRPRAPGNPGQVAVSGGSVKFGIDAGRGEAMLTTGSVQIQHGWTEFPGITGWVAVAPMSNPEVLWGHPNESTEYVDFFTDKANHRRMPLSFGTQLRFAGAERDYQVLYETRFDHGRSSLKDWPVESLLDGSHGWQHGMAYYWEWQKPRLRQVLGREALIDVVVGNNDYTHTLSVYRIPEGHEFTYDSGGFVVTSGMPLLKTVTIGNPTIGGGDFPSDDLQLAIGANGGDWSVACEFTDWMGYPTDWSVNLVKSGTSTVLLEELWSSSVDYLDGDPENPTLNLVAMEAPVVDSTEVVLTMDGEEETETTRTVSLDSLRSLCADPLPRVTAVLVEGAGGSANTELEYASGANAPDFPVTVTSNLSNEPETVVQLQTSGLPDFATRGTGTSQWKTEWDTLADGRLVATSTFGGPTQVYTRNWIKWENGGLSVTTYSAPDGNTADPDDVAVAWSKLEAGSIGGSGFPGLPHKVTRSDGTGSTFAWTIAGDGSGSLVTTEGLLAGGGVSKGSEVATDWNARGFTTTSSENLLLGGTLKTAGSAVPEGEFTAWGMPKKWKDDFSTIATAWTYDNNLSRLASVTSPLGLTTEYSAFDPLGRLGQVAANGITATNTFTGQGVSTGYSGTDILAGTQSSTNRDALGRLTTSDTTWNGVADNLGLTYENGKVGISRTPAPYGTHSAEIRTGDGSLSSASGPTLAFGGVTGDSLSIVDGLLVTRAEILNGQGQGTGAFEETHTDAFGRVCKIVTPSKSGGDPVATTITHSPPNSSLRRVITTEPTGRILITETDPFDGGGALTRSGIDVNGNGSLGASDRYTESVTEVAGGKVATTLKVTEDTGLREVLKTEWTPSTGVTVTKVNGNEETITTTPNRTTKTVTTTSSKGWTRTTALNSLGLPTGNTLSGTGIPTTGLTPVWRADGSLESVELTIGGETHSAAFHPDGRLSSLTAPGRGNILGGHTIANGIETLTVDGVTVTHKLNGTETDISGGDTIGRNETLTPQGGGFKHTVTPDLGGVTDTVLNAAFSPTSKTYTDNSGEAYTYDGELLKSVTLARGEELELEFEYSGDGAQDLTSATWPTITSGPFTIPGLAHGFTYNRSGQIKTLTDPSGSRTLGYENGRLVSTAYTVGLLRGHEVIRAHDTAGRNTGATLKRDGAVIHSVEKAPNGVSDQITALASGSVKVVPLRDNAGRVTGFQWGNAAGNFVPALTQTWQRGPGGRIEYAGSDVAGAPSFDYLLDSNNPGESFDSRGRRLKCETAGGTWTYTYGLNGQLTEAIHEDASDQVILGDFQYAFDAIGRRTDKGTANTASILNQTTGWTHSQPKKLTLTAQPGARVWFNGNEIQNFTGNHQVTLGTPGSTGQWVEWHTLAVLEGAGEGSGNPPANSLADPDAKSEKRGAVWVPPTSETLAYDAAGNRQGNAQWDYGWDAKNQLVRARTKDYDTAPQGWDIRFTYDAEGRRVRKHVIELREGERVAEKEITFIWDGWGLLYERHQLPSGLTTLERKYLWGPDIADGAAGGAGGLLLIRETKGNTTTDLIPLSDGTGHVVALTNLNKDLLATYAYGPFGEKISATGPSANTNPWRWGTKYLDEETGLYYFGHRYYDPITGQFLSREPLGESESLNLYSYGHNDPVNNVDRLGLESVPVYRSQISEAMAKLGWAPGEYERKSAAIDGQWAQWMKMFAGLEALAQKGDPKALHQMRLLRDFHQGSHEMNDLWLDVTMRGAQAQIDVASAGINRIYKQTAFLEWAAGMEPGHLDPSADPAYFDDDNPEFRSDEWSRRFIQFNPGGKIAREAVNGNFGAMSYEFGKEVLIWSACGFGGELLTTGRVTFAVGRFPGFAVGGGTGLDELAVIPLQPADDIVWRSSQALAAARGESVVPLEQAFLIGGSNDLVTIVAHGSADSLAGLSYKEFAALLKANGFRGIGIELVACKTGSGPFAQGLANSIRVPVIAARGNVNVLGGFKGIPQVRSGSGLLPIGQGFSTFQPQSGLRALLWKLRYGR